MCVDLCFDGGALLKHSGKIRNWGRWPVTVYVRLPNIDFVVGVRLQNMLQNVLSIRVGEKEILVGKIIWGDKKLENSISRKLLTSSGDSYFSRPILKSPNENICSEDSFESLRNTGEI